jgi:hypothetical protein
MKALLQLTSVSRLALAVEVSIVASSAAIPVRAAAAKPNIICITVDDMGYHDLGCFGSKTIQTPKNVKNAKKSDR